jgi:hypothetical protein
MITLQPGPGFTDEHAERAAVLAGEIAELAQMPAPRRAAYFQRLAPELLDVTSACQIGFSGGSPPELAVRVVEDPAFATELSKALRHIR